MTFEEFKNDSSIKFVIFDAIRITHGPIYSLICDLPKSDYVKVEKRFGKVIDTIHGSTYLDILDTLDPELALSSVEYAIEQEWGTFTTTFDQLPRSSSQFEWPGTVSHGLIDLSSSSKAIPRRFYEQLSNFGAQALQFRLNFTPSQEYLQGLIESYQKLGFRYVELTISFDRQLRDWLYSLDFSSIPISKITLHGADKNELHHDHTTSIITCVEQYQDHTSCGAISRYNFDINEAMYRESLQFNNCLNGKVGVDIHGNLCNCPSLIGRFGNIHQKLDALEVAVKNPKFTDIWKINKAKISICSVCEYRYVCTDCRAYLDSDLSLAKPSRCNYDPYKGVWQSV